MDIKTGLGVALSRAQTFKPPIEQEVHENRTPEQLAQLMKFVGFADSIIKAHRVIGPKKDWQGDRSVQNGINSLYEDYTHVGTYFECFVEYITNYTDDNDDQTPVELKQNVHRTLFDEKISNQFTTDLISEFKGISLRTEEILEKSVAEINAIQESFTPEDIRKSSERLKADQRIVRKFEASAHARFGFWLTDVIMGMFIVDENLRKEISSFMSGNHTRQHILGDNVELKVKAAEEIKLICESINVGEESQAYRDAFTNRINYILFCYEKAMEPVTSVLGLRISNTARLSRVSSPPDTIKSLEPPKATLTVPTPELTQTSELTMPVDKVIKPKVRKPKVIPTKRITRREISAQKKAARVEAEKQAKEAAEIAAAEQAAADARQAELDAEQAKEAAELAEIERQLAELEVAERASTIPEVVVEVTPDAVEKLYGVGAKIDFDDIKAPDQTPINESAPASEQKRKAAAMIRAKRKFDMKEAATEHGAKKLVVLKASKNQRAHKEAYMVILESDSGDPDEDIIMLDGDNVGTAAYVATRQCINQTIEQAEIRAKRQGEEVSDEEMIFVIMQSCRNIMRSHGATWIIHNDDTDVALALDVAVEEMEGRIKLERQKRLEESALEATTLQIDHSEH
jgi:hypothetical protein